MNEMNARVLKKSVGMLVMGSFCTSLLSACASNPQIDPASPLAGRVDELVQANRSYPRLDDFPAVPENLPSPQVVKGHVQGLQSTRAGLTSSVAVIDWQIEGDAEAFVADVRRKIDSAQVATPTESTPAEIEAFAQSLRQQATPPPPIDRPMR